MSVVRFETDNFNFDGALCREIPESWYYFFPDKNEGGVASAKTAKSICEQCPVRKPCAEYAISNTEISHGIWGGLTARQIQRIRGSLGIGQEVVVEVEEVVHGEVVYIEFTERD